MPNPYKIKQLKLPSGGRTAFLVERATGIPLFDPCVYTTTVLEPKGLAANSVVTHLRAIMLLYVYFEMAKIDIDIRIKNGECLQIGEIDELISLCRQPMAQVIEQYERSQQVRVTNAKVKSLEHYRLPQKSSAQKKYTEAKSRVSFIRNYIDHLLEKIETRITTPKELKLLLTRRREETAKAFNARLPAHTKESRIGLRRGLTETEMVALESVLDPESPQNPFKSKFVRYRNALLLHWFFGFTVRRGDVLKLKIGDINFTTGIVRFENRPNDKEDPRQYKPDGKTYDRDLKMSNDLLEFTEQFIFEKELRGAHLGEKTHSFLFISDDGEPLSLASTSKIFRTIRERISGLPKNLSSHWARYTVNEWLTRAWQAADMSEEQQNKTRRYMNGWSAESGMVLHYNREIIRQQANVYTQKSQEDMLKGRKK